VNELLTGAFIAFSLVAVVFFIRFWQESKDRLFLLFAAALLLLVGERIALTVMPIDPAQREVSSYVYLVRLVAFSLIIWGMIDKNRAKKMP
jgi:hypothetical protein